MHPPHLFPSPVTRVGRLLPRLAMFVSLLVGLPAVCAAGKDKNSSVSIYCMAYADGLKSVFVKTAAERYQSINLSTANVVEAAEALVEDGRIVLYGPAGADGKHPAVASAEVGEIRQPLVVVHPATTRGADVAQPHLTGVWQGWKWDGTGSADFKGRKTSQFLRWLASSRDPKLAAGIDDIKTGLPGNVATLVRGHRDPAEKDRVDAQIVPVTTATNKLRHGYAWAVFDESTKLPIALPEPGGDSMTTNLEHLSAAPLPGYAAASKRDWSALKTLAADRSKLVSAGQSGLTGLLPADRGFHDLTPRSSGILADVAKGGLAVDLSRLFSNASGLPSDYQDRFLYSGTSTPLAPAPARFNGANAFPSPDPSWNLLHSHYRLYDKLTGGLNPALATTTLERPAAGTTGAAAQNHPFFQSQQLGPVIAKAQFVFSLSFGWHTGLTSFAKAGNAALADNNPNKDLYITWLVVDPVITLWNPYNVNLRFSGGKEVSGYLKDYVGPPASPRRVGGIELDYADQEAEYLPPFSTNDLPSVVVSSAIPKNAQGDNYQGTKPPPVVRFKEPFLITTFQLKTERDSKFPSCGWVHNSPVNLYASAGLDRKTSVKDALSGLFEKGTPLANPRFIPHRGALTVAEISDALTALDGYLKTAAHLLIDSPLNVNSARVDVWEAVLASTFGGTVPQIQNGGLIAATGDDTAFSRHLPSNGAAFEAAPDPLSQDLAKWNGHRHRTDPDRARRHLPHPRLRRSRARQRDQGHRLVRGRRPARTRIPRCRGLTMGHPRQTDQHPLRQAL